MTDDDRTIATNLNRSPDDPSDVGATTGKAPSLPKIPGYSIIGTLGAGGMGVVYRGSQEKLHRPVAIKVLKPELAADPDFAARFKREADVAARLSHPNIVGIYDVGELGNLLFMCFQFVGGGDLADLVRDRGPLSEAKALGLMLGCCDGLQAIADAGLVHRDIKPGNIFLDDGGRPVIGDLGLARSVAGNDMLTMTGHTMGTPAYMSPEHLQALPDIDIRTDIYALGASLFKLVTGKEPYGGDSPYAITHMVLSNEPTPDPRVYDPSLSDAVLAIIRKAMAKDRSQRYQTALEMKADVEAALAGRPLLHALGATRPISDGLQRPASAALTHSTTATAARPGSDGIARTVPAAPVAAPLRIDKRVVWLLLMILLVGWFAWLIPNLQTKGPAKPGWASEAGRDAHGRWANLDIKGHQIQLRHISAPDGVVIIGSHPGEPGFMAGEEQRTATIAGDYWIASFEIDQDVWRVVSGGDPSRIPGPGNPVESVTCQEAEAFCKRLAELKGEELSACRLPTEAEWEYAVKAGRSLPANWQSQARVATAELRQRWEKVWAEQADENQIWDDVFAREPAALATIGPLPVGGRAANAWGLSDGIGNVAEWCRDAEGKPVSKGGSWFDHPWRCRPAAREPAAADLVDPRVGLRIVIPDNSPPDD